MTALSRVNEGKDKSIQLDILDKKIIGALFSKKRISQKQIARKCRTSKEVINYRLKRLQKRGVIQGTVAIIDNSKLGYQVNIMYLKLQKINREKQQTLIKRLTLHQYVKVVATCTGPWDMFVVFCTKDISHLDKIIIEFQSIFKDSLKRFIYATILEEYFMPYNYIHKSKSVESKSTFNLKVNKTDLEILRLLSKRGDTPITDIAGKVGLTAQATSYRIKRLIKAQIILGFFPLVNISLIGYHWHTVSLFLHNISKSRLNSLLYYLKQHPNIVCVIKTVGQWNLEFDIHVNSSMQFSNILTDIREEFSDIINDFESNLIFFDYKYTHFPKGLLKST